MRNCYTAITGEVWER